jgi:membrane-associated phospholipid phosphatase
VTIFESGYLPLWLLLTRLGEAQIVLPCALLAALVLLRKPDTRRLAVCWMLSLGAAIALTTVSKLAFIGWGIGFPELDFTGISGHSMFASAVYPLLFGTLLAPRATRAGGSLAVAAGFLLAFLIGISRVMIGVHSVSEVVAGLLAGGIVSVLVLGLVRMPRLSTGPIVPAVLVLFVAVMPVHAPASMTHSAVTRLSLLLSGNKEPYTRADMLHKLRGSKSRSSSSRSGPILISRSKWPLPDRYDVMAATPDPSIGNFRKLRLRE